MFDPAGKEYSKCTAVVPPRAITDYLYKCDRIFHTQPVQELFLERQQHGLIYITGSECKIYTFYCVRNGIVPKLLAKKTVTLAKGHKKGGQSQHRIERLHDESHFNYITKMNELAVQLFIRGGQTCVNSLIIAGRAHKKDNLEKRLDYRLKNIFLGTITCCDEKEAFARCAPFLAEVECGRDSRILRKFFDEMRHEKAVQGLKYVRRAFKAGQLRNLIIHADSAEILSVNIDGIRSACARNGCSLTLVRVKNEIGIKFIQFGGIGGIKWY